MSESLQVIYQLRAESSCELLHLDMFFITAENTEEGILRCANDSRTADCWKVFGRSMVEQGEEVKRESVMNELWLEDKNE